MSIPVYKDNLAEMLGYSAQAGKVLAVKYSFQFADYFAGSSCAVSAILANPGTSGRAPFERMTF